MPGYNQKGPMGKGPMTGRRMGRCTNFGANPPQVINNPQATSEISEENAILDSFLEKGQGLGRGRGGIGRGMGLGHGQCGLGRGMGRQNRFRGGV